MRIAVTGATGFIGRHVVQALSSSLADVVVTSRGSAPADGLPTNLSWVPLDLAAFGADPFEQLGRPDVLVHLAWEGLPNYDAAHHIEVELPRQIAFLSACLRGGLPHLVVAGTCQEYGLREGELREDQAAVATTQYGQAKSRLCEFLLAERQQRDFGLAWLRVFYLFGPNQAPTSLYSLLQAAIDRGDPDFPMSPGDQVRDFMAVQDAAAIIRTLACARADTGVVNLCSGAPSSVMSLVQGWIADRGGTIVPLAGRFPYPSHEPLAFWGSRTQLDRHLESSHAA